MTARMHKSVASFSPAHQEHTIIVHGFAKAWSMTGWRLGFLAAPEPIAKAIDAMQSHSTSNPTSFAQKGALAAITGSHGSFESLAGGIRQAPPFRAPEIEQHSRYFVRERERRVLPVPEHFQDRPQVHRILREAARSRKRSPPCPASRSARTITSASATPPAWRTLKRAWSASSGFAKRW